MTADRQVVEQHKRLYKIAKQLLEQESFDQAIHQAKENIKDNPPPVWYIRNCILVVCAEDDWERAESYRSSAEYVWNRAKDLSNDDEDDVSLERRLYNLRRQLDDIARTQAEMQEPGNENGAPTTPSIAPSNEAPPRAAGPSPTPPRRGRPPGSGNFNFRCPQQRNVWWSVSQSKFDAATVSLRRRYANAGRVMEVTGIPRQGGVCARCAAHGWTDCVVEPNGTSWKCGHCIFDSVRCE